jgi:hypothetical protein
MPTTKTVAVFKQKCSSALNTFFISSGFFHMWRSVLYQPYSRGFAFHTILKEGHLNLGKLIIHSLRLFPLNLHLSKFLYTILTLLICYEAKLILWIFISLNYGNITNCKHLCIRCILDISLLKKIILNISFWKIDMDLIECIDSLKSYYVLNVNTF